MLPIELVRGAFILKLISMEKEKSIMCILREMEIDDKRLSHFQKGVSFESDILQIKREGA